MRLSTVALLLLLAVVIVWLFRHAGELADFDFGTGTVSCGVAGLSTSCGSTR